MMTVVQDFTSFSIADLMEGIETCCWASCVMIIELVSVNSDFRNKGIGSSLVRAALDWLAQRGVYSVYVGTYAVNTTAARMYEKLGFQLAHAEATLHVDRIVSTPISYSNTACLCQNSDKIAQTLQVLSISSMLGTNIGI